MTLDPVFDEMGQRISIRSTPLRPLCRPSLMYVDAQRQQCGCSLVVRIPRCGRGDLGSNPSSHTFVEFFFLFRVLKCARLPPAGLLPVLNWAKQYGLASKGPALRHRAMYFSFVAHTLHSLLLSLFFFVSLDHAGRAAAHPDQAAVTMRSTEYSSTPTRRALGRSTSGAGA